MTSEPELYNDRNVYILGAGFSADAGLPLLGNFMNRMKDALPWLVAQKWTKEVEAIRNLLRFRQESAAAAYRVQINVENIEDLFSLAAATDNSRLETDLVRAIAGTLAFAEKTAASPTITIQVPEDFSVPTSWTDLGERKFHANRYDYYVGVLSGHFSGHASDDNAFITFNYDTLVESAARRLGIPWSYGFAGRRMRYEPHGSYSPSMGDGFRLLKIHGSVSWALPGKRGQKLTPFDTYDQVRQAQLVPVIVPPTWKKGSMKYVDDAWSGAVAAIEQATRVFIVGCSLPATDVHFRYLMAAGLRNNISLRSIYFVNPAADEDAVRQRVMSIFPGHLRDQDILKFHAVGLGALCAPDGRRNLNREISPGFQIWA